MKLIKEKIMPLLLMTVIVFILPLFIGSLALASPSKMPVYVPFILYDTPEKSTIDLIVEIGTVELTDRKSVV